LLTIKDLVDLPSPSDVRLSPDAEHVAYVIRKADRTSVWVDERPFTRSDGSEDQPRWSGDGQRLAFRSNRAGRYQVFSAPLHGGEATPLTHEPEDVHSYALSPRGALAFATSPSRVLADPIHIRIDDDVPLALDEPERILRLRSGDGRVETVARPPGWIGAFAWSPTGDELTFVRRGWPSLEGGAMPATIETIGGKTLARLQGAPDELAWTTGGLFYQGTVRMAPRSAQCLFRLGDGARVVAGDGECLGGGTGNAATICGHGPDDLAVLVARGLSTELMRVDPATGAATAILAPTDGDIQSASVVGAHWAAVLSYGDRPAEVYVDGRQISSLAPSNVTWPEQRDFVWTGRDGLTLDGVLLLPPGHPGGRLPTVVIVHGGPYGSRVTKGFQYPFGSWTNWGLVLANAGFAVLLPNYRGGLGRGEKFAQAEGGLPAQWDDVQTCVDAAIERGIADPERLGIGGWSYGGYMSAWAVGHTDRYRAAIVGGAPSSHDVQAMAGDLLRYARRSGSMPWDGPAPLPHHEFNTIAYVPMVQTPVLVMHGARDSRVPLVHAIGYHRGLRECGKTTELVIYRDAPHTLAKREHRIDCATRFVEWFERWLTPAAAGNAP
jgi:dipeptidyl aminopeptidase/acylaminoacyl peptidase